ncbi:MAG TPA: DUF4443 domain-containing protein [Nitrososphaeraceae archaeon]|nr:DUF4443 domain-containing protein [Nitrososphaeraceae archaeon]
MVNIYVKTLAKIASRYAPSRTPSFNLAHLLKTLQLMEKRGHVSRPLLCRELSLGEGVVRTLLKHLKMKDLIETTNSGTRLTEKGITILSGLVSSIPSETSMPKSSAALGKFNYAVLLRQFGFSIKSGIEQRDAAIKMGATGATTLLFENNKFLIPSTNNYYDSLEKEPHTAKLLIEKLQPEDGDVIIIGSAVENVRIAELAAKNAALLTIVDQEARI